MVDRKGAVMAAGLERQRKSDKKNRQGWGAGITCEKKMLKSWKRS
jgi:hypothetical protein